MTSLRGSALIGGYFCRLARGIGDAGTDCGCPRGEYQAAGSPRHEAEFLREPHGAISGRDLLMLRLVTRRPPVPYRNIFWAWRQRFC